MNSSNVIKFLIPALLIFISSTGFCQNTDYSNYGMETIEGHIPSGLSVGEKAPDFSGYDQNGKFVELKQLLENGPVILFFYRGVWCPVCNRYLSNFQDSLKILTDMGATVVAITPESVDNVGETVKKNSIDFTVIYDCSENIMKDFDVMFGVTKGYQDKIMKRFSVDIAKNNDREVAHLPVPATYIIDRSGTIVAVHFDPDYHYRATIKWMMQNLGKAL